MNEPLNPYALGTWQGRGQHEHDQEQVFDAGQETLEAEASPVAPDPSAIPRDFSRPDEYARRALNQAKAAAKKHGYVPRRTRINRGHADLRGERSQSAGYSGARPDARDPQPMKAVLEKMLINLGWDRGMSEGRVLAEWEQIVGPAIAAHSHIVSFEDGVLVISADSSAWASQLRMLGPQIITKIHQQVGSQVVSEIKVAGPAAKSWKKGKRTVNWRGPRDTYG